MKTVLILGGYGGFGARLSQRLANEGWHVLVAGRRHDAARAFCERVAGTEPAVADRDASLTPLLALHRPDLVIDAAGPFQESGYQVPQACIDAGVNYLDLADGRAFVVGVAALDSAAKRAGVSIVSGASSVPGLSGAVIRRLTSGMNEVHTIDVAISASNRATAGRSVAAAILSYIGRPVRLWRGGLWIKATGWHDLRREIFSVTGLPPISRLTALADVPDNEIWPGCLPGCPATTFRAGPEFAFQTIALWLMSWPVKWKWLSSLSALSAWLPPLQGLTARLGSDTSAMMVDVRGTADGRATSIRWTLVAERGDGPEIPVLAAELLAEMAYRKSLPPGATHAGALLTLDQFKPLFEKLAIRERTTSTDYIPLYQRVMGSRFEQLTDSVRRMHTVIGDSGAQGRATVTRGASLVARLICGLLHFPRSGDAALHVSFSERNGVERWTRNFGDRSFSSELSARGQFVVERFGPLRFTFHLGLTTNGLEMILRSWSMWHIPMPLHLAPRCCAREWEHDDAFCFDVELATPWLAPIIRYVGSLRITQSKDA